MPDFRVCSMQYRSEICSTIAKRQQITHFLEVMIMLRKVQNEVFMNTKCFWPEVTLSLRDSNSLCRLRISDCNCLIFRCCLELSSDSSIVR